MLVKSNVLGLLGLPGSGDKPVVLKPGVNEVSDKDWEVASRHPGVTVRLEDGSLEVLNAEGKVDPENPVSILCALKVIEAKKAAKETIDVPLLQSWLAAEKRSDVKQVIQEQLTALQATVEYRENKKDKKAKK